MPNTPRRLVDRFLAISSEAKVQPDFNTGLLNADLDLRHRAEITIAEVISREEVRDCRNEFLIDEKIRTRALRWTLNYPEVTPQLLAIWSAYYLGAEAGPTGTPANETQTLTRSGTVSGGTFTLSLTLEGRTATTKPIAFDATTADIKAALEASRMIIIQPGDVEVTGDWTGGMVVEFVETGRLGRANLPLLVADSTAITGGGSIAVAETVAGAQNAFDFTVSPSRVKPRFSMMLGWEDVTDRFEKYVGAVVESLDLNLQRRQNVGLTVSIITPWEPEILDTYTVPECYNPNALLTDDCRVSIDANWETLDINTLSLSMNDNVPIDDISAFGFDAVDIQVLERGDQPSYQMTASLFASEGDNIYDLALNERTADEVAVIVHCGNPGNRISYTLEYAKIKFQDNRFGFAGALNKSTVNFNATPYRLDASYPIEAEAYLDQATPFLETSS